MRNRKKVEQSQICGCYYCQKIFSSQEVKDYTDQGQTALCPICMIDAVITEPTEDLLKELHIQWF